MTRFDEIRAGSDYLNRPLRSLAEVLDSDGADAPAAVVAPKGDEDHATALLDRDKSFGVRWPT